MIRAVLTVVLAFTAIQRERLARSQPTERRERSYEISPLTDILSFKNQLDEEKKKMFRPYPSLNGNQQIILKAIIIPNVYGRGFP